MPKVKVFLYPWGSIEKYRFSHFVNSITTTNPFGLDVYMDDDLEDCEVYNADGAHVRDAVLDARGNIGDFKAPFVPPPHILDIREIVTPHGVRIPTTQINGPRVSVGYGNIFGEGLMMQGASEEPVSYHNLCSIGSFCSFGSGVVLNTDRGFRIHDICTIGDLAVISGSLTMGDRSSLGRSVAVAKAGSLSMSMGCRVGDTTRIVGSVLMGAGSKIERGAWFKNHSYAYVPVNSVIPVGHIHQGGDIRSVL